MRLEIISPTMLKTGLFNLRSSCLMRMIGFLQYRKNPTTKIMLITPGMRKNTLIENTLAIKTRLAIGPYIESVSTKPSILSMIPKSLENLLFSRPVGVRSK